MSVKEITFDELVETNSKLTEEILKGEEGWDIVNILHHGLVVQLLSTSSMTAVVLNNGKKIMETLDDPKAFEAKFMEMFHSVKRIKMELEEIEVKHKGKKGQPTVEELDLINDITQQYSQLTSKCELEVYTKHIELYTILENEMPELVDTTSAE